MTVKYLLGSIETKVTAEEIERLINEPYEEKTWKAFETNKGDGLNLQEEKIQK